MHGGSGCGMRSGRGFLVGAEHGGHSQEGGTRETGGGLRSQGTQTGSRSLRSAVVWGSSRTLWVPGSQPCGAVPGSLRSPRAQGRVTSGPVCCDGVVCPRNPQEPALMAVGQGSTGACLVCSRATGPWGTEGMEAVERSQRLAREAQAGRPLPVDRS